MWNTMRSGAVHAASSIILSLAVLILALAAGYYLVIVLPGNTEASLLGEGESSSQADDGPAAATESEPEVMTAEEKANYEACLNAANEANNQRHAALCEEQQENRRTAYLACIQNQKGEEYCQAQFGEKECDIAPARMAVLNAQFEADREACAEQ